MRSGPLVLAILAVGGCARQESAVPARDEQKLVFEGGDGRPVRFTFEEMDPAQVARYHVDVERY